MEPSGYLLSAFRSVGSGVEGLGFRVWVLGFRLQGFPRDPNSPMQVRFTDFKAQCRYYLYTWIPRVWGLAF